MRRIFGTLVMLVTAVAQADQVPPTAAPATAPAPARPASASAIARAQFTSAIERREPVDALSIVDLSLARIYFFTEVRGLAGHKIKHRWRHQGQVMHEVEFTVGAARYRTNSYKSLNPAWAGEWQVEVVDGDGTVLGSYAFRYGASDQAAVPLR